MTEPDHDQPAVPPAEVLAGDAAPMADDAGTGDPRVDAAVTRLAALAGQPVAARVDEYEAIHRALQDTLATVDEA